MTWSFACEGDRYEPCQERVRARGIPETRGAGFLQPLRLLERRSADQYVLDYARTFGLRAVVFRMSCIYGPHQCGTEDQGWVAHFPHPGACKGKGITLYGDGKQVRDVLFVEDLVEAFLLAEQQMPALSGQAFNLGGGVGNTTSLLELLNRIHRLHGCCPETRWSEWRPGDQRYYVSDITRFRKATGWTPKVTMPAGIERLYHWLREHRAAKPARNLEAALA